MNNTKKLKNLFKIISFSMIVVMLFTTINVSVFAEVKNGDAGSVSVNSLVDKDKSTVELNEDESVSKLGADEDPTLPVSDSLKTDIASIEWKIDTDGVLTLSGSGTPDDDDLRSLPWKKYNKSIKKIKVEKLQDIDSLDYFFSSLSNVESIEFATDGMIDTSGVYDMSYLFSNCESLKEIDLTEFDISNVYTTEGMFKGCKNITSINLSGWDIKYVSNISEMFFDCEKLEDLKLFKCGTSYARNVSGLFSGCKSLKDLDLTGLEFPLADSVSYMFNECTSLESLKFDNLVKSNITNMDYTFAECKCADTIDFSIMDTSNVTSMKYLFEGCNFYSIDLSDLNVSNVNDMEGMFRCCKYLYSLKLPKTKTTNVENFSYMFSTCDNLKETHMDEIDFSSAKKLDCMYLNCNRITTAEFPGNLVFEDVSAYGMFENLLNLKTVNFSNCVFNKVNMNDLFSHSANLVSVDMSNATFKDVKGMAGMFSFCSSIEEVDLSNISVCEGFSWDRIWELFKNSSSLKKVILPDFSSNPIIIIEEDLDVLDYCPFAPFYQCTSLEYIDMSGVRIVNETSKEAILSIFYNCENLKMVITPNNSDVKMYLPEYSNKLGPYTWYRDDKDESIEENVIDLSSKESIILSRDEKKTTDKYNITIKEPVNGRILVNNKQELSINRFKGNSQKVFFVPDNNYYIKDVIIDGKSQGAISFYEFKDIDSNHTVEAIFSNTYRIGTSVIGDGNIISASGAYDEIKYGKGILYRFVPKPGNLVKSVIVDGEDLGAIEFYEFKDVKENHSLRVEFIKSRFTINFDSCGGSISQSSMEIENNHKYGELPVPQYKGYVFAGWYTSKKSGQKITSESIFDREEDITLYAHWDNINLAVNQKYSVLGFFQVDQEISKFVVIKVDDGKASVNKKGILKAKNAGKVKVAPCIKQGKKTVVLEDKAIIINITKAKFSEKKIELKPDSEVNISKYLSGVPVNSNKVHYSLKKSKKTVAEIDKETGMLKVLTKGKTKVTANIINDQNESCKVSMNIIIK